MVSTAEGELGALFENAKEAAPIKVAFQELDHPQPATPIQVDSLTANRIFNSNIRQHKLKAIDTSRERATGQIISQNITRQLTIVRNLESCKADSKQSDASANNLLKAVTYVYYIMLKQIKHGAGYSFQLANKENQEL
eukprot:3140987-Ditylum_brightwellii.AAC.1